MVERKFSELRRQASAPQGVWHACVRDRHEVILQRVVENTAVRIDHQKKAVVR
jgi:hypothetical protein